MHAVRFLRTLAVLVLVALGLASCKGGASPTGDAPRHVIFVTLDTSRADRLGAYGSTRARTPNLDALARESIVFTDCMTPAPTTLAAHTSIFTGAYPHSHGVPRNGFAVDPANRMLPEILHDQGFRTAGFIGSYALASPFLFCQGFDHFDESFDLGAGKGDRDQDQRTAARVTDAVLRYVDESAPAQRRFLFVHYFDPHYPYDPPGSDFPVAGDPEPRVPIDLGEVRDRAAHSPGKPFPDALRLATRYAGEVAYLDREIGRLLQGLRDRGILDRSILVLASDHGETFWEHRAEVFEHGYSVYQPALQVVCMVRLPASAGRSPAVRGRIDGSPVTSLDLLPTVLDRLGLEVPGAVEGTVLDLAGPAVHDPARPRFAEATKPWAAVGIAGLWPNAPKARCIRLGRWKYVRTPYRGTEELYDLTADPGERSDLLGAGDGEPPREAPLAEMRRELRAWGGKPCPRATHFVAEPHTEANGRLRRLGYLSEEPASHP